MTSGLDGVVLVAAGVLAGLIGSAGGITSLVSYPALLVVGLAPLPASITNSIALVACWPGSALSSRQELRGWGRWLRRWTVVTAAGGVAGALLLLATSPGAFRHIVPGLVALGSLALLLEPRLTAWREARGHHGHLALPVGLFALSLYNGYFGAGSGVMTLTLMLLLVDQRLPVANALKNMLIGAASLVSAVIFAGSGRVDWTAAAWLGLGMLAGSNLGPRIARRIPAHLLRLMIGLVGLGLSIQLALSG